MAVQSQTPFIEYIANGVSNTFDLAFDCEDKQHLIVKINDEELPVGSWSLNSGQVIFNNPPPLGKKIFFRRNTPNRRDADYKAYDNSFKPKAVNLELDKIWLKLQELGANSHLTAKDISDQGISLEQLKEFSDEILKKINKVSASNEWFSEFVTDGEESQKQINDKTIQSIQSIEELKIAIARKNGQKVLVNNRYVYTYSQNSTVNSDGISAVVPNSGLGRWLLQKPVNIHASDFCKTSLQDQQSQSENLQRTNDVSVAFGIPFIVDDEFMVSPVEEDHGICFRVRSNNVITFTPNGRFKLIPNNLETYSIVHIENIENYRLETPNIFGDRDQHLSSDGEWGYGLTVYQCKNGYIHKPKIENTWGDGIYIGRRWGLITSATPTDVTIFEPIALNAGRNGVSLCAGTRVRVIRPFINGVRGKAPEAGIDIEPESANSELSHLKECSIDSPTVQDCKLGLVGYFFPNNSTFELEISGVSNIKDCVQPLVLCAGGVGNKGYLDINKIQILNPTSNTLVQNAWHESGTFKCVIKELVTDRSLPIVMTMNGDFNSGKLGNFEIHNIINTSAEGKIGYYVPPYIQHYEDNSKYIFESPERAYLDFDYTTHFFGKNFSSNISVIHKGWTISSRNMPNNIWLDPSLDTTGTSAIFISTGNDYRRLKIGLSNLTTIVGQGCNISGLKLRKPNGTFFTEAHTQTIGAWLEFQNNLNGNTEIFNQYGDWTFT